MAGAVGRTSLIAFNYCCSPSSDIDFRTSIHIHFAGDVMLCGFSPARQDDGSIACAENLMRRLFFLLALMCWTVAGVGQSNYGVISGAVSDAQHLRVAGAVVELKAAGTGAVRHVVTNDQGLFEAPALLPDDYEIKAAAQGFAVATQSVRLEVGQKLEV